MSNDNSTIATRVVRRRIEKKLAPKARRQCVTTINPSSPISLRFTDLNVWRIIMQFLIAKEKLAFMQSHKLGQDVVKDRLSWKYLHHSFESKRQHQICPFFLYITSLKIDCYNPTFKLLIEQMQHQLHHLELSRLWYSLKDKHAKHATTRQNMDCVFRCTKLTTIKLSNVPTGILDLVLSFIPPSCKSLIIQPLRIGFIQFSNVALIPPKALPPIELKGNNLEPLSVF